MTARLNIRAVLSAVILMVLSAAPALAQSEATYTERYRPQYHFTPPVNWMNDPNGLVYYDGEYHLFYQYNPFGITWGHMSWGHAVSPDLMHWEHLPVALEEENNIMIFSGSAVVDWNNTSGFGSATNPPMVAIYTGDHTNKPLEDQRIAYSLDNGRTWTKYEGNPVLDIGKENFRDPKVIWYEPEEKWVMVVALPVDHKVQFYESKDLKHWEFLSEFGPAGATEGVWECPDLFPLPVDGNPERMKWVLVVNLNPGAVAGGSGGQYFIGTFDRGRFIPQDSSALDEARWIDYGKDFYAVQSWFGVPEQTGRRLWIGWMSNWQYAEAIPTSPWRSAQSLPRRVMLRTIDGEIRLVQQPVVKVQLLRRDQHHLGPMEIPEGTTSLAGRGIAGKALEIIAEFEVGSAEEVGLKVRMGEDQETLIGYNATSGEVFVDRTRSGADDFHPKSAGRHSGPFEAEDGRMTLHVFVDWSSVEVFAGQGETVITDRIFPDPESDGVALYAKGGTARLVSLDVWKLDSVWEERGIQKASTLQR